MNKIMDKPVAERVAHKGLFSALAAAQAEMGPALKDATNPHFRSKYADLASVQAACLPALNAHGIAVMQPPVEIDGQRYVKTVLAHESGEREECLVPLIVAKNDMQGYGSAVTYARRYGLMAMAGVAPDDDDGNAAVAAAPRHEAPRHVDHPRGEISADVAIKSLANAETLDQLAAIWRDLGREVQEMPEVLKAKDRRKAALAVVDDEIPY